MKNLLFIILTLATFNVVGQNHLVGFKGGVSLTNISASNFQGEYDDRTGIMGGLSYEYLLNDHFSMGTDVIYNQRGFRSDFIFMDELGNQTGEKAIFKFNYDYLSLPLKAGYRTDDKLYTFANIGLVPSILTNAKTVMPLFDENMNADGNETIDITDKVAKFDLAALAEIGVGYSFRDRCWLYSSCGYLHSFTTITNDHYFADSKISHNGLAFSIGIKYALKNK